ncbi:MAG: glycosyl hydrolase family 18 protein [Eubacteriales bacterium]|nr:glycosyl hydrolase family 18 protein [Eubacteriales bacterium]
MEIYTVRPGDNVDRIAARFGVPVEALLYDNQLSRPYPLAVGQALLIPSGTPDPLRPKIVAGGYAYPYIRREVLEETLPWLSDLYVFSYRFSEQGDLLPPEADDRFMTELALQQNVRPILTLTPFNADGSFDSSLIHALLSSPAAQERLIGQLADALRQKGFWGVDIDFEYVYARDREAYPAFVAKVRRAVRAVNENYRVSVALSAKTSASQKGLLYEGLDYRALGEAADSALLMTYEWGYAYGPPMAIAPINEVRRVVEYALTEIPAHRLDLGIPNYGYDWPLPFRQGETKATAVTLQYAVQLAIENDAAIRFDEASMSPHFRYRKNGTEHEVWFEDVRSLREKFSLLAEYDLRGAGYWQIMRLFFPNWILLSDTFRPEKG